MMIPLKKKKGFMIRLLGILATWCMKYYQQQLEINSITFIVYFVTGWALVEGVLLFVFVFVFFNR